MTTVQFDPRVVRMPQLGAGEWLNTERPFTRETLRGQVVLIDFWDYSCINCIRTFPYLTRWHQRYANKGLTIIGVHAPEFKFAHLPRQVETAVSQHQLPYPILLDNQYHLWNQFANKAWPTKYLIDSDGYIRLTRRGEGHYREMEQAIQLLLRQHNPDVALPDLLPPLREEDTPGAVCYRPTPEIYAGYQGGGFFAGGLGNPEGYVPQTPVLYQLPPAEQRTSGQFYADGIWHAWPEALAYAGQSGGRLLLPYSAVGVNAVLGPTADPVEQQLDLRPTIADPIVEVRQNSRYLSSLIAGDDIEFDNNDVSFVRVTHPRLYQLVQNVGYQSHELEMIFRAKGLALYTFTFTTCLAPRHSDVDTITMS